MLMTVLHTAIAISSQSIKMDVYNYKVVSNQKDGWSTIKCLPVFISIPSLSKKEKGFII